MNPTNPNTTTVICPSCDWSRRIPGESWAAETLDYHLIQVHNDQAAVKRLVRF